MNNFSNVVSKSTVSDNVYVVYFGDGTMYNYYNSKEEADEIVDSLNSESIVNKAIVKAEPKTNFELK